MIAIEEVNLISVNGKACANKAVDRNLGPLGSQQFVILPGSPRVLSVGMLVEQGFSFLWFPIWDGGKVVGHDCQLRDAEGRICALDVVNRVPVFKEEAHEFVMPKNPIRVENCRVADKLTFQSDNQFKALAVGGEIDDPVVVQRHQI